MKGKEKNNKVVFPSIQGGISRTVTNDVACLLVGRIISIRNLSTGGKRILLLDDMNNNLDYQFLNPNNVFNSK